MANGQIREDEVSGGTWPVEINHASDGRTSQDGGIALWVDASMGDLPSLFKGCKEEIVGIELECDVLLKAFAFEDTKLDNWRRVDRATVSGGCSFLVSGILGYIVS